MLLRNITFYDCCCIIFVVFKIYLCGKISPIKYAAGFENVDWQRTVGAHGSGQALLLLYAEMR